MKFKIYATRNWNRADDLIKDYPCLKDIVDIENVPFERTKKIRDENNKIIKQIEIIYKKVAYITINNLEELMNIISAVEEPVIISCNKDGSEREIEIYDGFREY